MQKQIALESLEVTLALQALAHKCFWGRVCDSCRNTCSDPNGTSTVSAGVETYRGWVPYTEVSSFDMLLEMFIEGDPIGSRFSPDQELIFLKIGGRSYNDALDLAASKLTKLRKSQVHAVYSAKYSYEFYKATFGAAFVANNGNVTETETAALVTDSGCDFSGVMNTAAMLEEVTQRRCATVAIFDATVAFENTAFNNLYLTLCILGVLLVGGLLIYADLRLLFEPLEHLTETAALFGAWLHKKMAKMDSAAEDFNAQEAAMNAAAVAVTAAHDASSHPIIGMPCWIDMLVSKVKVGKIVFVGRSSGAGEPEDAADANMARVIDGDWNKQHVSLEVEGSVKINGSVYKNRAPIKIKGDLWVHGEVYKNDSLNVSGTIFCTRFYHNRAGSGTVAHSDKQYENSDDFDMHELQTHWFEMGGRLSYAASGSKHELGYLLFEMAEEAMHSLTVTSATTLLLCESLQTMTGVPLERPLIAVNLIKHSMEAILALIQRTLDHIINKTLTWRAIEELAESACETIFASDSAACDKVQRIIHPLSRSVRGFLTVLAESMRTLSMEQHLQLSNGEEGVHLPDITNHLWNIGQQIEQLGATVLMASLQYGLCTALKSGEGSVDETTQWQNAENYDGGAASPHEHRAAQHVQTRWRDKLESRRSTKFWAMPLSGFVVKVNNLLLPPLHHTKIAQHFGALAPCLSGLDAEQKRKLTKLVLTSMDPADVCSMGDVWDFLYHAVETTVTTFHVRDCFKQYEVFTSTVSQQTDTSQHLLNSLRAGDLSVLLGALHGIGDDQRHIPEKLSVAMYLIEELLLLLLAKDSNLVKLKGIADQLLIIKRELLAGDASVEEKLYTLLAHRDMIAGVADSDSSALAAAFSSVLQSVGLDLEGVPESAVAGVVAVYMELRKPGSNVMAAAAAGIANTTASLATTRVGVDHIMPRVVEPEAAGLYPPAGVAKALLAGDCAALVAWIEQVGPAAARRLLEPRCVQYGVEVGVLLEGNEAAVQRFGEALLLSKLKERGVPKDVLSSEAFETLRMAVKTAVQRRNFGDATGPVITAVGNVVEALRQCSANEVTKVAIRQTADLGPMEGKLYGILW
jgi:hypothetical protein